jgi:hypothetical protein
MRTRLTLSGTRTAVSEFSNLIRGIHRPLQVSRIGPLAGDHYEVVVRGPTSYATDEFRDDFIQRARDVGCELVSVKAG